MSDSYCRRNFFDFTDKAFGVEEPEISNEELTKQIEVLSEKIKDIEIKLSGKYGVLYIPTKEEIIKITKEQLIEEYKRINNE